MPDIAFGSAPFEFLRMAQPLVELANGFLAAGSRRTFISFLPDQLA